MTQIRQYLLNFVHPQKSHSVSNELSSTLTQHNAHNNRNEHTNTHTHTQRRKFYALSPLESLRGASYASIIGSNRWFDFYSPPSQPSESKGGFPQPKLVQWRRTVVCGKSTSSTKRFGRIERKQKCWGVWKISFPRRGGVAQIYIIMVVGKVWKFGRENWPVLGGKSVGWQFVEIRAWECKSENFVGTIFEQLLARNVRNSHRCENWNFIG